MNDCYGIQSRRWDNDHPSWDDEVVFDTANFYATIPLRFATQAEAEAWITWHCDRQYEADLQAWDEAEERLRPRRELYERRRQALVEAGLWLQPGERPSPLVAPAEYAHVYEPVRHNDNYRVVSDADMDLSLHEEVDPILGEEPLDPCLVCEVAGGALVWRDGMFSCHGCWTRTKDSVPFQHAEGCPKACWLPGCSAHGSDTANDVDVHAGVAR